MKCDVDSCGVCGMGRELREITTISGSSYHLQKQRDLKNELKAFFFFFFFFLLKSFRQYENEKTIGFQMEKEEKKKGRGRRKKKNIMRKFK